MLCLYAHCMSQYNGTNMVHFSFSLLRINSLYIFRSLLAHRQEALPFVDEQVMIETCRSCWFSINWMKSASRWSHHADTLWCTVSRTLRLSVSSRTRADYKLIFPCCSANFRVVFDSHLENTRTRKRVAQTYNSKRAGASVQRPALCKYIAAKRITLQVPLLRLIHTYHVVPMPFH
jgi:hypothetical protein